MAVHPDLTLTLGMRYDVQSMPTQLTSIDTNNVAPRIGFSWTPFPHQRTVMRGSYEIFYGRVPARIMALSLQRNGGTFKTATLSFGETGAPTFPNAISIFLSSANVSYQTMAPSFPVDSSVQVSGQVEQALAKGILFNVGYNHVRGLHLSLLHGVNVPTCTVTVDPVNLCRPNPNFGNID